MKRLAIGILLAAVLVPAAVLADEGRRDGNWWRTQSAVVKKYFLGGFFDGLLLGNRFSVWDLPEYSGDKNKRGVFEGGCADKAEKSFTRHYSQYFSNVTSSQIADGLDALYADYRNRSIEVHSAMWLVVQEISGKPKKEMEEMIESWRRGAAKR